MRNLTITLGLVIFALAGFYGGAKYESGKTVATTNAGAVTGAAAAAGRGTGGFGGFAGAGAAGATGASTGAGGGVGFGGRGTFGQIVAVNGNTLTVQDAQGQQVKVQLQPTTTVTKTVSGATSDLAQGENVTVTGQRGSDGTVTATAITITPAAAGGAPRG